MLVSCWSVKGGVGTTVVSAALGVLIAGAADDGALLVDLAGDLPAVLGLAEPPGPGVSDWLRAGSEVPDDGLQRIEVPVADRLGLVPRGVLDLPNDQRRADALASALAADRRTVVVDCGCLTDRTVELPTARAVAGAATRSLLVIRPCYLALRRAVAAPLSPSSVVVVEEPGRALDARDIEDVLGVPVLASVPVDAAVARAVDAGLLASRLPRSLARSLRRAA